MPNQNRGGLDDLDILDLDDLLREDDKETESETKQQAPAESDKKEPRASRRRKHRQASSDRVPSEQTPRQEAVQKEAASELSAAQEKAPVQKEEAVQTADQTADGTAPAEEKKGSRPAASHAVPEKPTTEKKEDHTQKQPAEEDELPDGINFVDVVPAGDTRKKDTDSRDPGKRPAGIRKKEAVSEVPEEEAEDSGSRRPPLHLILPIVIAAVLVIAVVRFMVWSKGTDLHIDSSGNADRFNIEVNDNMVYLPDSKLKGHEDDGVTTILCLGNEPFSEDTSDTGLAGQIASLGNCNVINAAFPDSQVTCENATYSTDSLDSMDDIFNLFYVSYAISIGDFSSLKTVASVHTEDPTYEQSVEALENTDFSKVDMIAIMYDGIDYINGMAMQNPDVPDELTTYVGSLINSFQLIQEKYPYIRIVFLSPYYAEYDGASSRTTDLGNGTIVNYFQWAYDTCGDCSVSFLDNYYGSINETNYKDYLSDGIHLNAAGRTKVADHFVYKVLQDNYAEYNAQTLSVAK